MAKKYKWSDIFSILFIFVGVATLLFLILRGVFTGLANDTDTNKYEVDTTTTSAAEKISSSLTTTTISDDGLCSLGNDCVMTCYGSTDLRLGIEIESALIESGCRNNILLIIEHINFTQRVLKNNWIKDAGDIQVVELEIINCNFEAIEGGAFASTHFKNMSNLTIKNLQVAYLENQQFRELGKLNYLSIEDCKTSVSIEAGLLGELPSLTQLQIHGCLYDPRAVGNITGKTSGVFNNLQIIDFTRNMLQVLPSYAFSKTPKLQTLILAQNNLTYLPKDVFWSTNLKQLSLEGNKLETIEDGIFRSVIGTSIMLGDNPWRCECDLKWLQVFLQKVPLPERYNAKCQNNGTSVTEYNFNCPDTFLEVTEFIHCISLPMYREQFAIGSFKFDFYKLNSTAFRVAISGKQQNKHLIVFETQNSVKQLYNCSNKGTHFDLKAGLRYTACLISSHSGMECKPEERTSWILSVANATFFVFILLGTVSVVSVMILCYFEVQKHSGRNVLVIHKTKETSNKLHNVSKGCRNNGIVTTPNIHIIKDDESSTAGGKW